MGTDNQPPTPFSGRFGFIDQAGSRRRKFPLLFGPVNALFDANPIGFDSDDFASMTAPSGAISLCGKTTICGKITSAA